MMLESDYLSKGRRIVRLDTSEYAGVLTTTALCDDGTAWVLKMAGLPKDWRWVPLPAIPQP